MTNEEAREEEKRRLLDGEKIGSIVFWMLVFTTTALVYQGEVYQYPFGKAAAVLTGMIAISVLLGVVRNQIIRRLM
jgi:hypothetical protein